MSDTQKHKDIIISAKRLFSPSIKSPKLISAFVFPETTFSQIKEAVFIYFNKSDRFLPSCFSDLRLSLSRSMSAFGLRDNSTISDVTCAGKETECCSGGNFTLTASLGEGLPGGSANLAEEEECFVVRSTNLDVPIRFKSFRLSCRSHVYTPDCYYAGIVLYAYEGQTEWWLNGQHCKSGYTIILNTEILEELSLEEEWQETEGVVHGMVFYYLFRCEIGRSVGEGFAIMDGVVKWNSTTFNARKDGYHDGKRIISKSGMKMLDRLIQVWKRFGEENESLPLNKNFTL